MQFRRALAKLRNSEEFRSWHKENKGLALSHAFTMLDEPGEEPRDWQFGFYNRKTDKVATFNIGADIEISPESEIFKKKGDKVLTLDADKVKVKFDDARRAAREYASKKYPQEKAAKEIVVLQNLGIGQVWNITFLTTINSTLNIKISAEDAKVVGEQLTTFADMIKK